MSPAPEIRQVSGRAGVGRFLKVPFRLYRDDPLWVPPLLVAERELLNPRKNPFFEFSEIDLFIALRGDVPVGRIAAIENPRHNEVHGDNLVFFGFFEAEDQEVASELLRAVEEWARARGRDAVRGPANPSLNDSAGLQISAFDTSPYLMMPYNPPSYPGFVESAGYAKVKDLYAWHFDVDKGVNRRIQRLSDRVIERTKPTIRTIDLKDFDVEMAYVREIYTAAWKENWGFVAPTDREFEHIARNLRQILDPDLVVMIELEGRPVAFSVSLPDLHQVFKLIGGRLLPFGIFKLLRWRKYVDQARLLLLGVLPEYRGRGLEVLCVTEPLRRATPLQYRYGECSWTLETNSNINKMIAAAGCTHYKTYRLYEKAIGG